MKMCVQMRRRNGCCSSPSSSPVRDLEPRAGHDVRVGRVVGERKKRHSLLNKEKDSTAKRADSADPGNTCKPAVIFLTRCFPRLLTLKHHVAVLALPADQQNGEREREEGVSGRRKFRLLLHAVFLPPILEDS